VWQCQFTLTESEHTFDAVIRWTDDGTAATPAGVSAREVRYLDRSVRRIEPGDDVEITEEPVMIVSGGPVGR
jgi:hypothetical protein